MALTELNDVHVFFRSTRARMFFDMVWYAASVLIEGQKKNDHVVEEEGSIP